MPKHTINTSLVKRLPAIHHGFVQRKRKYLFGFEKQSLMAIKSSYLLLFANTSPDCNVDDVLTLRPPSAAFDITGATCFIKQTHEQRASSSKHFVFHVQLQVGGVVTLSAPSEAERDLWMAHISEQAGNKASPGDFSNLALLGKGHFGKVYLSVHRPTGGVFAMKEISRKGSTKPERLIGERSILEMVTRANSPFLGNIMYAFKQNATISYVSELYVGGDMWGLIRKVKRLDVASVRHITSELILGVEALHEMGIVHRDIKLENVLLDHQGHVKLVDFGLSKQLKPADLSGIHFSHESPDRVIYTRTFSVCGTNYYMSPEMLTGGHGHGLSLDWWQVGCLVYELFVGRPAFYDVGALKIHKRILSGPPQFPSKVSIPNNAKGLILKFLIQNSTMRLGSKGSDEVKQHGFFDQVCWEKVAAGNGTPPKTIRRHLKGLGNVSALISGNSDDDVEAKNQPSSSGGESISSDLASRSAFDESKYAKHSRVESIIRNFALLFPDATDMHGVSLADTASVLDNIECTSTPISNQSPKTKTTPPSPSRNFASDKTDSLFGFDFAADHAVLHKGQRLAEFLGFEVTPEQLRSISSLGVHDEDVVDSNVKSLRHRLSTTSISVGSIVGDA